MKKTQVEVSWHDYCYHHSDSAYSLIEGEGLIAQIMLYQMK